MYSNCGSIVFLENTDVYLLYSRRLCDSKYFEAYLLCGSPAPGPAPESYQTGLGVTMYKKDMALIPQSMIISA